VIPARALPKNDAPRATRNAITGERFIKKLCVVVANAAPCIDFQQRSLVIHGHRWVTI